VFRCFTPQHLLPDDATVEIGTPVLILGFPLGFHDQLHRIPVVRQAVVASSFGLRFQGQGYFLTDARTHRGSSGAPVIMRSTAPDRDPGDLPWVLLGIHSARLDVGPREPAEDEALGLTRGRRLGGEAARPNVVEADRAVAPRREARRADRRRRGVGRRLPSAAR
jgi:hypothetical protein